MASTRSSDSAVPDQERPGGAWVAPPRQLPSNSEVELTALVARAERALLRLDGALSTLPSQDTYLAMHRCREAVLSASLAGHPSSLATVLSARSGGDSDRGAASECLRAIELTAKRASTAPFTQAEIARLRNTLEGSSESGGPQEVRPSHAAVDSERPRGITEILDECRDNDASLPPLVHIGLAQGRIESWRPFQEVSGRMARVLVPALADQLGIPGAKALGISGFLVNHSSAYRQARKAVETSAEWTPWLTLFLTGVAQSASDTTESIRQFADLRERHRSAIGSGFGHATVRGLRVLERLFIEPYTSIAEIRGITGTSFVAANQLASRLVDIGVLEEVTGYRRNRVFRYGALVGLFDEVPSVPSELVLATSSPLAVDRSADRQRKTETPSRLSARPKKEQAPSRQRTAPKRTRGRSGSIDDFLL